MTPREFKAWFEGFTEAMDGQPTPAQWAKIKERVAQIDGTPTSYPVYVDRYVPRRYWDLEPYRVWCSGAANTGRVEERLAVNACGSVGARVAADGMLYNAAEAMLTLGKADYRDMDS
jgi:hypothetical protein